MHIFAVEEIEVSDAAEKEAGESCVSMSAPPLPDMSNVAEDVTLVKKINGTVLDLEEVPEQGRK